MDLTRATFKKKEIDTIPVGAKILSKDVTMNVEEIENGYLLCKCIEIKYEYDKRTDYSYTTKKWFSTENPISINTDAILDNDSDELIDKF